MQFLEFKIVNTKLMAMGGGDPQKQMEERTAYLDKIRKDAEEREKSGSYQYASTWNPFPKFVQQIIKDMAAEFGTGKGRAQYNDENQVFKLRVEGGRMEYDEFYDEFNKRFNTAKEANQDDPEWWKDNVVRITSTPEDENTAMDDLASHHRSAALPGKKKNKSEAE